MAMVRLDIPFSGPFGQPQLGAAAARFTLLLGPPASQRMDEIIMCELVIGPTVSRGPSFGAHLGCGTMRLGRGDQPCLAVENRDKGGKVPRPIAVTGGFQEFEVRTHVALNVAPRFRQ